jgi:predicted metal-dependent hydrolase
MTHPKHLLQFGTKTIEYSVIPSKRIKTSEITVDANGIIVRTPYNKTTSEVQRIIKNKADWIQKQQEKYRERELALSKTTYKIGFSLPYLGNNYLLKYSTVPHEGTLFRLKNKEFLIYDKSKCPSEIRKMYELFLKEQALVFFSKKVKKFSKVLDVHPTKIMVKNLRNRWGSMTKGGIINLNYMLMKAPLSIIDYIIIHELCHLNIKSHSYRFWLLLSGYVNDYKQKERWLSENSLNLIE